MAKYIQLRWVKIEHDGNSPEGYYYESNLIKLNSPADIQVQLPERDVDITYLLSLSGEKFVSIQQDYFAELHIRPIPVRGNGQIVKFRINKLPEYAIVMGEDIEDAGDTNPDNSDDVMNGFAGSDGEYFRGINSEIFAGKQPLKPTI